MIGLHLRDFVVIGAVLSQTRVGVLAVAVAFLRPVGNTEAVHHRRHA